MRFQHAWLILPVFFVACGDGSSHHDHSDHHDHGVHSGGGSADLPIEETVVVVDGVTEVKINGNDRMKFSVEAFSVPAGSPVKLVFNNLGKMPKSAMGHNVVFLKPGVDENAFAAAAAAARDRDFIPEEMADAIIAHTKMLGPGESDTIEFAAPSEPGEYTYICSFPAHMFAGMRGVMKVE